MKYRILIGLIGLLIFGQTLKAQNRCVVKGRVLMPSVRKVSLLPMSSFMERL